MDDSWDQIGKRLRAARDKAELSVDDVVFRARIPKTVIDALEADDFSFFTSPTYAKSFLRQYSEFLKVDAEPWLNALEPASYIGGESWQPMLATGPAPASAKRSSSHEPRSAEKSDPVSSGNKWSTVWLICFSALLIVAIFKGYQILDEKLGKGDDSNPAKVVTPAPSVVKKPEPVAPKATIPAVPSVSVPGSAPIAIPVPEVPVPAPAENPNPVPTPRAIIVRD